MVVQSMCLQCSVLRSFATRTLLTAPSVFPKWTCPHFGLECYETEQHPIFSIAPNQWLASARATPLQSPPTPIDHTQTLQLDPLAEPSSSASPSPVNRPRRYNSSQQKHDISTPPEHPETHHVGTLTPSAKVETIPITGFLTWSQVPPHRRISDSASVSLRNPSSLRCPVPSHYMVGDALTRMHEPDPSRAEVEEFSRIVSSSQ